MILRFADVELDLDRLDLDRYELRRAGTPVAVEPQVFDVLAYLAGHRERVVPKEELLDNVWGAGLRGDWAGAAAQWAARGETYEEALELCSGEDAASVATGRELLRSLGAVGTLDALGR